MRVGARVTSSEGGDGGWRLTRMRKDGISSIGSICESNHFQQIPSTAAVALEASFFWG